MWLALGSRMALFPGLPRWNIHAHLELSQEYNCYCVIGIAPLVFWEEIET